MDKGFKVEQGYVDTEPKIILRLVDMVERQKPQIYDDGIYRDFGKQPSPLELQLGNALIPLVEDDKKSPIVKAIQYCRNQIDDEFGLPLPKVHIIDNASLKPKEYRILLNGVEVSRFAGMGVDDYLCINTSDDDLKEIPGKKLKDPAYDMDAILIHKDQKQEAKRLGYSIADVSKIIRVDLYRIVTRNITKFLTLSMVGDLINKVRNLNPDVVDNVFFIHDYPIADFKIILNWLLEERVSIKDMSTIIETIAENIADTKKPVDMLIKIREMLAYSIISKLADDKKIVHVVKVSKDFSEFLSEKIYHPKSRTELPYFSFNSEEAGKINKALSDSIKPLVDKGFVPVVAIESSLRTAFADKINHIFYGCYCISDFEMYRVSHDFSFSCEGEIALNES